MELLKLILVYIIIFVPIALGLDYVFLGAVDLSPARIMRPVLIAAGFAVYRYYRATKSRENNNK